jgi:NDP-sugar pyrophosphorylase family protein
VSLAPVCILAGGLGTRLGERVRDTPKPLIEVAGKPFLLHQFDLLRACGAHRIVLCVGYLGERIEAAIGDGSDLGLDIRYRYDPPELAGTAGAIRAALDDLGERFLVLYGDTYLRVDYRAVEAASRAWPALMTVFENAGRWDVSNVLFRDGRVVRYDKRAPAPDMRWIDYGLSVLTPAALEGGAADLADVMQRLAGQERLGGYLATERFYEIGTPESLAEADAFLATDSDTTPRESSGETSA